jgi:hypothetical protein
MIRSKDHRMGMHPCVPYNRSLETTSVFFLRITIRHDKVRCYVTAGRMRIVAEESVKERAEMLL